MNNNIDLILEGLSKSLDISRTDFQKAETAYNAVGKHLGNGLYTGIPSGAKIPIYTQGSMRLGTVVRPLRDGNESDYDIDLVFELPITKEKTSPSQLKTEVGQQLKSNAAYESKLNESKRCWTLSYENFHMDILPAVANSNSRGAINITDNDNGIFKWRDSNPNGYADWFDNKCLEKLHLFAVANAMDESTNKGVAEIEKVPEFFERSVLQRIVQIMKRHRDISFKNNETNKPISMIITTLAASFYGREHSIYKALKNIIESMSDLETWLDENSQKFVQVLAANEARNFANAMDSAEQITITRNSNGYWNLPNPVNRNENFADKWHLNNNAKAKAFFSWIKKFQHDMEIVLSTLNSGSGMSKLAEEIGKSWGEKAAKRTIEHQASLYKNCPLIFTGIGIALATNSTEKPIKKNTFFGEK